MILPKKKTPSLEIDLINGTKWVLEKQAPKNFTLLLFYRGLHCPKCKEQLEELKGYLKDFSDKGVNLVAISMDTEKRAKITSEKWDIESIPLGYNLSETSAKEWGLYISNAISDSEPDVFSEPGLFLVKPDGTLYSASIQTMPFARPQFDDLLDAIDFILEKEYPARGGH